MKSNWLPNAMYLSVEEATVKCSCRELVREGVCFNLNDRMTSEDWDTEYQQAGMKEGIWVKGMTSSTKRMWKRMLTLFWKLECDTRL